jgi:ribosomal protein L11 methyltransferase
METESKEVAERASRALTFIRDAVLEIVSESGKKLTPQELEKRLSQQLAAPKAAFKETIRRLVDARELTYTYQYGCSFLEKAFNRPVRISKRVVLKPPEAHYPSETDEVVVNLQPGAAFGSGEHPTTRLAIRGIEQALSGNEFLLAKDDLQALDIGTGSGVLAITAVLLGIKRAVGLDIEPCARTEAFKNVQLNNLEKRIEIQNRNVEDINTKFELITANLRYPTLKRLGPHLAKITETGGAVVVSGVKTDEVYSLLNRYKEMRFECTWQEVEKDWVGLVFER